MNQLLLQARIEQLGLLRYTPAGLPALDIGLKHESQVLEAGSPRKVLLEMKAVAIGELAKRIQALGVGHESCYGGFLAAQRNGRGTVFHITELNAVAKQSTAQEFPSGLKS
ncbi:primosomal replication protein N [Paucibacter sp. APW11]|uniref:Replication restart protein PriB n=1 Tax=Roseateles aquae TaxID=3077235 RepID=A0ABU3P7E4_9BURK|nr:primosomal replication protein N [Paucibacter sp. APW11]MDT8998480.1 primosomal replication protein N [Paucibacter sp. APW11]